MFPRRCHICGGSLAEDEECLCTICLGALPRTGFHRVEDSRNAMVQRFAGLVPFRHASGHFFYSPQSPIAGLMIDLKYHHYSSLARRLGRVMGEELRTTPFLSDVDCVVPIPMHWLKQSIRGYNPAREIAVGFAEGSDLELVDAMIMTRHRRTQTKQTLDRRLRNASGLFAVTKPEQLDNRHVLLLDDVCTTGATMLAAAQTLRRTVPDAAISMLTLGVTF